MADKIGVKPIRLDYYECGDCLYEGREPDKEPCDVCRRNKKDNYIHKSQKPKDCIWCAYLDKPSDEPPCKDCDGTCNYVSWRGCGW